MGAPRTFPRIVEIFKREAGKVVTIEQLSRETGLTEAQVRSAVAENRKRVTFWRDNINVLSRGQSWTLLPSAVTHVTAIVDTNSVGKLLASEDVQATVPKLVDARRQSPASRTADDGPTRVTRQPIKRMKTRPKSQKLAVGDLLEVIGYAGQDILARAEESGQVYRVSEL